MSPALLFLIALLICVLAFNWRFLAASFGFAGRPCRWSRIDTRDSGDKKAWFCPACGREELVEGTAPPPDCERRFNEPG